MTTPLCLQTLIRLSVTWSRNRLSSDQWILRHVLKFQPRRAKHHAKRVRRCRSTNSGRLMTLLDLSPADFRRFLTVLVDKRLLGSQCCLSTRLVANGIRLTKCDFCSLASHEPGFESHRAYLGHVRPSYTGSATSCAKHSSVGSSIASGMAAAITTGHLTSNWRDETQGWGRHQSTWGLHPVLKFEQ
jgi:hypothetical protein